MTETEDLPVLDDAVAGPAAGTPNDAGAAAKVTGDELQQALTDALMVHAQSIIEAVTRENAGQLSERLTEELSEALPAILEEVLGKTSDGEEASD